jgi:hypothetical protein
LKLQNEKHAVMQFPKMSRELSLISGVRPLFLELLQIKDIKRMRISPKTYSSHQIQFLEKTQTEAYLEFKSKYPEIKISQRLFENYKPFFVVPVRPKDRCTCCCRQHVEMRCVFKQCMQFQKSILKNKSNVERESYPIFEHISDIVKLTVSTK